MLILFITKTYNYEGLPVAGSRGIRHEDVNDFGEVEDIRC